MKKIFHFPFLLAMVLLSLSFLTSCDKSKSDVSGSNAMVGKWAMLGDGEKRIADNDEGAFEIFVFSEQTYYSYNIHGRYEAARSAIVDAYEDELDEFANEMASGMSIQYEYINGKISNAVYARTITWEDDDHIILDANSADRQYWTRIKAIEY